MKPPQGEFLELSFYFADQPEENAFIRLIAALMVLGAKLIGEGYAHRGAGIRDVPFAGTHDDLLEPLHVDDIATLTRFFADPNIRPIQVYVEGATGTVSDVAEIVTYVSVSPEAARTDRHPLAIWTEGYLFSGTFRETHRTRMKKAGLQAYQRFRALVEGLRPAYASITVEEPLECPADLRRDPRSYAFRDFFVSDAYLSASRLTRIQDLFSSAYIEPVSDGIYISCSEEFNPEGKGLEIKYALKQSIEVAKLIAGGRAG